MLILSLSFFYLNLSLTMLFLCNTSVHSIFSFTDLPHKRAANITTPLGYVHWLPTCQPIGCKIFVLTLKAIHNTAFLYTCNLVAIHKPNSIPISMHNVELVPLKIKCVTFGYRPFFQQ